MLTLRKAFSTLLIHDSMFLMSNGGSSGFLWLGPRLLETVRDCSSNRVVEAKELEKAKADSLRHSA